MLDMEKIASTALAADGAYFLCVRRVWEQTKSCMGNQKPFQTLPYAPRDSTRRSSHKLDQSIFLSMLENFH